MTVSKASKKIIISLDDLLLTFSILFWCSNIAKSRVCILSDLKWEQCSINTTFMIAINLYIVCKLSINISHLRSSRFAHHSINFIALITFNKQLVSSAYCYTWNLNWFVIVNEFASNLTKSHYQPPQPSVITGCQVSRMFYD